MIIIIDNLKPLKIESDIKKKRTEPSGFKVLFFVNAKKTLLNFLSVFSSEKVGSSCSRFLISLENSKELNNTLRPRAKQQNFK